MHGPTSLFQPWAIAMPAAVVGPPMLALDARMISSREPPMSLPPMNQKSMLMITIRRQKTRSRGACWMMSGIDAGTPMTKKKR